LVKVWAAFRVDALPDSASIKKCDVLHMSPAASKELEVAQITRRLAQQDGGAAAFPAAYLTLLQFLESAGTSSSSPML
jgi:hypothetical protein